MAAQNRNLSRLEQAKILCISNCMTSAKFYAEKQIPFAEAVQEIRGYIELYEKELLHALSMKIIKFQSSQEKTGV